VVVVHFLHCKVNKCCKKDPGVCVCVWIDDMKVDKNDEQLRED